MEIQVHDVLTMKKPHPCGSVTWEVLRMGADLRIRCSGCGHEVMLPRHKLTPRIRSVARPNADAED